MGAPGSDLPSWHPQRERFRAGDEKRVTTTIVGQEYSAIDLTAKRVTDTLNTKNDGLIRSRFVD